VLRLWRLGVSRPPQEEDRNSAETLRRRRGDAPVVLALNKVDLLAQASDATTGVRHRELVAHAHARLLSALRNEGVRELVELLRGMLPRGPRYFPADEVSEVNMRFIAAEIVREKVMLATSQEIPHAVAVEIEEYHERSAKLTSISALLYVERDSQKGILVGKGGEMIRKLGRAARLELEELLGTRVYLDLRVKTHKNWRKDDAFMRRLGFRVPADRQASGSGRRARRPR